MARNIPEEELQAIEIAAQRYPDGVTARQIADALKFDLPLRTLQYRLKFLVERGRLVKVGEKRGVKYHLPAVTARDDGASELAEVDASVPVSRNGVDIRNHVSRPPEARTPVGYKREFLDAYRPNVSFYLSMEERRHLSNLGKPGIAPQPAGTYARQILSRLLIDLPWNSSRLEGNTYSLLDSRRLIEFGEEAEGRDAIETQMILNHKDAIEFLVNAAEEIGFNRYTILNLHAILANNLLPDHASAGRLRQIAVGIEKSVFHPLEIPQLIEECFDQILATAAAIRDPFEQAFFLMVQLPYLQPFDDVNKRVARVGANIPLIKDNLCPLSFVDVPRSTYTEAVLGVYELNRIDLLKDVFVWAYERSAARYAAVRQSLGEPDTFRLRHRAAIQEVVAGIVRGRMDRKSAFHHVARWVQANLDAGDRERFREVVENELLGLHEGNFARYRIRPSEFEAWQQVWTEFHAGLRAGGEQTTFPQVQGARCHGHR